jgi:hypothetical protein
MIALTCYIELSKGKIDAVEVSERFLPMIQSPNLEFERGTSDANNAYDIFLENNSDPFLEFNNNIISKYEPYMG